MELRVAPGLAFMAFSLRLVLMFAPSFFGFIFRLVLVLAPVFMRGLGGDLHMVQLAMRLLRRPEKSERVGKLRFRFGDRSFLRRRAGLMFEAHDIRAGRLKLHRELLALDGDIEPAVPVHMGPELPMFLR